LLKHNTKENISSYSDMMMCKDEMGLFFGVIRNWSIN
jgi:hypothetical protein